MCCIMAFLSVKSRSHPENVFIYTDSYTRSHCDHIMVTNGHRMSRTVAEPQTQAHALEVMTHVVYNMVKVNYVRQNL